MNQLKAEPGKCEEASIFSREKYIPCNAPAIKLVYSDHDNRAYRMCEACAYHSIKNRHMVEVSVNIQSFQDLFMVCKTAITKQHATGRFSIYQFEEDFNDATKTSN